MSFLETSAGQSLNLLKLINTSSHLKFWTSCQSLNKLAHAYLSPDSCLPSGTSCCSSWEVYFIPPQGSLPTPFLTWLNASLLFNFYSSETVPTHHSWVRNWGQPSCHSHYVVLDMLHTFFWVFILSVRIYAFWELWITHTYLPHV